MEPLLSSQSRSPYQKPENGALTKEAEVFFRAWADELSKGGPTLIAMDKAACGISNQRLRLAIAEYREALRNGVELGELFAKYPDIFPGGVVDELCGKNRLVYMTDFLHAMAEGLHGERMDLTLENIRPPEASSSVGI